MVPELLRTCLAWLVIYPAIFSAGRQISIRLDLKEPVLQGVYSLGFGMALLSFGMVLLHFAQFLNAYGVWIILALLLIAGGRSGIAASIGWLQTLVRGLRIDRSAPAVTLLRMAAGFSFLFLLLGTLTPEIGGDALCYQLNLPKRFLDRGSLAPIPFDENSFFPLFINNLYLAGLAVGGVFTAKLFHALCGLLIFTAIDRLVWRETRNRFLALFAGLIVLLTPGIFNQLSTTYLDVALACYTFLAAVLLFEAFGSGRLPAYLGAGFLLGCCLATKYLSVMAVLALGPAWILAFMDRDQRSFRGLGLWLAGILLAAGYWLGRNAAATGNPFYPYFGEWFTGAAQRPPQDYFDMGAGKSPAAFLAVFWNMFRKPDLFGAFSNRIGLYYTAAWPLLVPALLWSRAARRHALFTLLFIAVWFNLVQADRWIYPVLPAMSLAAALGFAAILARLQNQPALFLRAAACLGALALTGIYLAGGAYHYRHAYGLFLGRLTPEQYLQRHERTYPVSDWVNKNLPQNSKILLDGEVSKFYFEPEVIDDSILNWQTRYHAQDMEPAQLLGFYAEKGITHMILRDPLPAEGEMPALTPPRRLVTDSPVELLAEIPSENIRDARYIYRIYALN